MKVSGGRFLLIDGNREAQPPAYIDRISCPIGQYVTVGVKLGPEAEPEPGEPLRERLCIKITALDISNECYVGSISVIPTCEFHGLGFGDVIIFGPHHILNIQE